MMHHIIIILSIYIFSFPTHSKQVDYRTEIPINTEKTVNFHLEHAKYNIILTQYKHAFGNLSYVLCTIPNHIKAFKLMNKIATIDEKEELIEFYENSLNKFDDHAELHAIYSDYLLRIKNYEQAKKHFEIAMVLDEGSVLSIYPNLAAAFSLQQTSIH